MTLLVLLFSNCHKNKSRNYYIFCICLKVGTEGQIYRSWKRCSGYVDAFDTVIGYKYVSSEVNRWFSSSHFSLPS